MDTRTPEWIAWKDMRQRCLNPNNHAYASYGGRGIGICERWSSSKNFIADMGPRPAGMSLERINNDLGYEPGNCKWATPLEQMNNRRGVGTRTHCPHGHERTPENTIVYKANRQCRVCNRIRNRIRARIKMGWYRKAEA